MEYISYYISPLGRMLLAADDEGLTGLWFEGQRYFALHLDENHEEKETPVHNPTIRTEKMSFSDILELIQQADPAQKKQLTLALLA